MAIPTPSAGPIDPASNPQAKFLPLEWWPALASSPVRKASLARNSYICPACEMGANLALGVKEMNPLCMVAKPCAFHRQPSDLESLVNEARPSAPTLFGGLGCLVQSGTSRGECHWHPTRGCLAHVRMPPGSRCPKFDRPSTSMGFAMIACRQVLSVSKATARRPHPPSHPKR